LLTKVSFIILGQVNFILDKFDPDNNANLNY